MVELQDDDDVPPPETRKPDNLVYGPGGEMIYESSRTYDPWWPCRDLDQKKDAEEE